MRAPVEPVVGPRPVAAAVAACLIAFGFMLGVQECGRLRLGAADPYVPLRRLPRAVPDFGAWTADSPGYVDEAMEYLIAQRKARRIRYLGFSAHTESAALAATDRFRFDSVLFRISFASWLKASFGPKVVPKARRQGAAVLGIKVLCRERRPKDDPLRKKYRWWYKPDPPPPGIVGDDVRVVFRIVGVVARVGNPVAVGSVNVVASLAAKRVPGHVVFVFRRVPTDAAHGEDRQQFPHSEPLFSSHVVILPKM